MVNINWENTDKKHIGFSTCGKYVVEIFNNNNNFGYSIIETKNQSVQKSDKQYSNLDEAKRIVMTLLSLKYSYL